MKQRKLGVFLYNRLFDPVNQSNLWLYIKECLNSDKYDIYLISYESENYPLTAQQRELVSKWRQQGLHWTKLKWNPGTNFIAKGVDITKGFLAVLYFRIKGCRHYISLASVAGTFLYLYSRVIKIKLFLYSYEPHSEYAIDNKMWANNSLQFRVSNYLEREMAKHASVVASGTVFMERRLKNEMDIKGSFFKLPTVVDDGKFKYSEYWRKEIRKELGLSDHVKVLFYPGKFGGLYYNEETIFLFKWILEEDKDFHFLIITPNPKEEIVDLMAKSDIDSSFFTIIKVDYENIHKYYSAADFAVIAVPPGPSKKFISNIKVGEYLCAGLPFLITHGVSEDYLYAKQKKVGVVVDDFSRDAIKKSIPRLQQYFKYDKVALREHCRNVGLNYRGFKKLNKIFNHALQELYREN